MQTPTIRPFYNHLLVLALPPLQIRFSSFHQPVSVSKLTSSDKSLDQIYAWWLFMSVVFMIFDQAAVQVVLDVETKTQPGYYVCFELHWVQLMVSSRVDHITYYFKMWQLQITNRMPFFPVIWLINYRNKCLQQFHLICFVILKWFTLFCVMTTQVYYSHIACLLLDVVCLLICCVCAQ